MTDTELGQNYLHIAAAEFRKAAEELEKKGEEMEEDVLPSPDASILDEFKWKLDYCSFFENGQWHKAWSVEGQPVTDAAKDWIQSILDYTGAAAQRGKIFQRLTGWQKFESDVKGIGGEKLQVAVWQANTQRGAHLIWVGLGFKELMNLIESGLITKFANVDEALASVDDVLVSITDEVQKRNEIITEQYQPLGNLLLRLPVALEMETNHQTLSEEKSRKDDPAGGVCGLAEPEWTTRDQLNRDQLNRELGFRRGLKRFSVELAQKHEQLFQNEEPKENQA